MRQHTRHIKHLLAAALCFVAIVSCHTDDYRKECDYKVRLFYHYNRENTSRDNILPRYVRNITEYLFDGDGVLYMINELQVDICEDQYFSELQLPPGNYSVIAIGNSDNRSQMNDARVGFTCREEMLLSLENTMGRANGEFANAERLFYAYRTFMVDVGRISRVRVDMIHSHFSINYTIRWKSPATPPQNSDDYYVLLKNVPSRYAVMPQYYFPNGVACDHVPDDCDMYNQICLEPIHHIPTVYKPGMFDEGDCNIITNKTAAKQIGNMVIGQSITYRLRNGGNVAFSLHNGDGRVMKDIPICQFLCDMGEDLDKALRQEYDIVFEIDENDQVTLWFSGVEDWDEGGWVN